MLAPWIPSGCRVPLPVSSPASSAFPKSRLWVGFPESPRKETSCGGCFEIGAIPYVQASWFARHPCLPYRCAEKAAGQPGLFHPSKSRIVPGACIGDGSRLIQGTDGGRLSPPTLAALSAATRDSHPQSTSAFHGALFRQLSARALTLMVSLR